MVMHSNNSRWVIRMEFKYKEMGTRIKVWRKELKIKQADEDAGREWS